jgi:papain fold toxin 1 (glutamine deamidase) of polymorphic toxin system
MGGPAALPLINFPSFLPASATPGGREMLAIATGINPAGSVINCGFNIDAVVARLTGANAGATAPPGRDGSFTAIEARHHTSLTWGSSFDAAYDAVGQGGPGTMAIVGIVYSSGASHVVVLANNGGTVGIVEGQNWGAGNPQEVVTSTDRANERYNTDGNSNVGWGLVGSNP